MATPFVDIYDRAAFRFADYKFLEEDVFSREQVLLHYLESAKTDFSHICATDLTDCDYDIGQFNQDLDDDEKEILALGVAYYWLSFKSLNSELLKNVLNSKDYYYYSPANLLKEIQTLRKTLRDEFNGKMRQYSYYHNSMSDLKA